MLANHDEARRQMIRQQVRTWEVLDPAVLETLSAVPREHFVPPAYRGVAFADTAIPLGHGQHMLAPKLEGRILQSLALQRSDRVLEVGTGSGYLAACLAALAASVHSLEIHEDLASTATGSLTGAGTANVTVECIDATQWTCLGLFDAIAVTASLPVHDSRFEHWLTVGGRMFVIVGTGPVMQARRITRTAQDRWITEALFETRIDPLINAKAPAAFRF